MNVPLKDVVYYGSSNYLVPCDKCFHNEHYINHKNNPKIKSCLFNCSGIGIWTHIPMNGGEE